MKKIVVTGGAIIKDETGTKILLQKRSDYGDWGLPGGAMEPGESIEETMIREVKEETGLTIKDYNFYSVYSGPRMKYKYPDGNEVVFVMFLFETKVNINDLVTEDGYEIDYQDVHNESLELRFFDEENIDIEQINIVQKPIFEDIKLEKTNLIRE